MAKNVTSFCPMSIEMGFTSFLFRWFAIATVVVRSPHRKGVKPTSAGASLGMGTGSDAASEWAGWAKAVNSSVNPISTKGV